jgi:site-specific DNA-methyltransferase (adenine-specific)
MKMGYFDPCPLNSTFDGLLISWKKYNFVNPPYSITSKFVDKAIQENKQGKEVLFLIPARTDTKYFHKLLEHGAQVFFIKGRLKFGGALTAPFPSIFVLLKGY